MTDRKDNRTKWVHLRRLPAEYRILHNKFCKTTCRSLSEFVRKVLLDQPIVATYRNTSQDDLLGAMAVMTDELNAIGNNINQSVKRLHTLRELEAHGWASKYAAESSALQEKINEVKLVLNDIAARWLQ